MPAAEASVSLPDRYRIVRHIANGGMAGVWAAEDELLGRLVAVKVLSPAFASDERAAKRFMREARAGARLSDCRHVVTVYDIGEHAGKAFMVMEHFPGGTISDRLKSGRPIPRPLAVRWLREAAEALDCAHKHNVVHRDVKPANLLLDERGRLAVADFGIATVASEASVTQTGQVLGTAAYISPEQARGEPATAASDRYALAVVAYELLTGAKPYAAADTPAAQAHAHALGDVPRPSDDADDLPPAVDAVLAAGMAKDPAERPATAVDFVDGLEDALGDDAEPLDNTAPTAVTAPVAVPRPRPAVTPRPATSSRRPAAAAPPPRRRESNRWPALLVLAVLALIVGAVIAIATSGGGGSKPTKSATTPKSTSTAAKAKPKTTSTPAASTPQTTSTPAAAPPAGPTGTDPVALNNQGYALYQQGKAAEAVPYLQKAVDQFRAQGKKGDVNYAYALYNLGTALMDSGKPADAIPYLQERLAISSDRRGLVQDTLNKAQAAAGQPQTKPGKGNGKGKKKDG